jgi:hypothetical protein
LTKVGSPHFADLIIYRRHELSEPALRQVLEIFAGVLAAAGLLFE